MLPERIRLLDRVVGTPACAFLTEFERIKRLFKKSQKERPKKIVFIKLIEMGSTVLAAPAFAEASRMVGKENIYFLVFKNNKAIADVLGIFKPENIITIDDSTFASFVKDLFRAMAKIRREKIDTAIDMEGLTRSSAVITYMTGCQKRIGYYNFTSEGPYRGRLFTHELNYSFHHHITKQFLALVRAAEKEPNQKPLLKEHIAEEEIKSFKIQVANDEKTEIMSKIEELAGRKPKGKIFLLNPNCSDLLPLRRWPSDLFIELGKMLLEKYPDSLVAITGAPDEKAEASKIAEKIGPKSKSISTAGHTNLKQLIALYSVSDLLVTNDSGPAHFASLTDIPIVVLFGPETPTLYAPKGKRVIALTSNLACSPCVNILNHRFSPCNDNICMKSIRLEQVFEACEKLMD